MNTQSVNRRREDDAGSTIDMDRLSQLPQPILHSILSLLSQRDAVQTSVLSKSWRYLWHGRLNVEFRGFNYRFDRKKEFWPFLDKTLQRYLDQNLSLHKFLVDIFHCQVDLVLLQKWIPLLIMHMGVRSFTLISKRSGVVFPLPLVVFQSNSLVELHLERCDLKILESTDNVMLNNLQTLRLHYVDITDEIFEKIISGCPLINNLDMLHCSGLKSIKFHKHHNIKDFSSSMSRQIIIVIENTHTLESVRIENCRNWLLLYKNMHFPHLKSLNLYMVQVHAEMFDNFSSFFPCLNELILENCDGLKEFRLLSSSIKRLTIKMCSMNPGKRIKAFIDTPNIHYFEYHGILPSIKFMTTSNKWKSQISLWYKPGHSDNDATSWFLKLNKLLKALSESHITLSLIHDEYKKLYINDSYGGFYKPVVVEHLKLWGYYSSYFDPAILNCFFKIFRPRYIQMENGLAKFNLVEYISKLIPYETGCYFCLQDLEEVSIEVMDMKAREWRCLKGTILHALCSEKQIRFRLTWKEQ